MIAAGATGISGPTFTVGNQEEAFAKVLAAAFVKAKERATVLAAQAGADLGAAMTIEEGEGAEIVPVFADKAAGESGSAAPGKSAPTRRPSPAPRPSRRPSTSSSN